MDKRIESLNKIQKEAYQFAHEGRIESYKKLIPWIPEDVKTLLDIGSGYGKLAPLLPGIEVVSIDIYPQSIEVFKADMHDLPYAEDSFDMIFYSHTLEHSPTPVLALLEAYKVLRPGGYILAIIPSYIDKVQMEHITHWSVFPVDTWLEIFKRCGFTKLRRMTNGYYWKQETGNKVWRLEDFFLFQRRRPV